jgi:hypothetical protein
MSGGVVLTVRRAAGSLPFYAGCMPCLIVDGGEVQRLVEGDNIIALTPGVHRLELYIDMAGSKFAELATDGRATPASIAVACPAEGQLQIEYQPSRVPGFNGMIKVRPKSAILR